ncbi:MAG: hypothetical protein AAFO07_16415 [Bacteroidota bacterium]
MNSKSIKIVLLTILLPAFLLAQETEKKAVHEFELKVEGEYRYFYDDPLFEGQLDHFPSISFQPEYSIDWNDGYDQFKFTGFFRLDRDDLRTHWDIRELYYKKAKNNWELNVGLKKVFWGVTESNHLVDIINQTDQVESFDGEQKLGQPMAQFTLITNGLGTFDFFYLPYHRRRTFTGRKGRLRFPVVIEPDELAYESSAEEWRQDLAIRWSHYIGIVDFGLSHFYGNGREPLFVFDGETGGINAFYPIIHQTGLELQVTHDAFLWKLEAIRRDADAQEFIALTAGVEYTFSNIDGNGLDIGLLGEYLYDERDELALTALQNDFFFGSRIAFNDVNDTSILLGGIMDLTNSSKIFSMEASRRFGNSLTASLEARLFTNIANDELILSNFRNDSFLRMALAKYF